MNISKILELNLQRPLVAFDVETTGTNTTTDRIVSIALFKILPNGEVISRNRVLNPTVPIPKEASDVHGIKDEDVKDQPTFESVSRSLHELFQGCDLMVFNKRFDPVILSEEFNRVGIMYPEPDTKIVDAMIIYHKAYPRTLETAFKEYTGKELEGAHDAQADIFATVEVFNEQLNVHEIPKSVNELHDYCNEQKFVDLACKLKYDAEGDVVYAFGKHEGTKVIDEKGFGRWMLDKDFSSQTKAIVRGLINGTGTHNS